MVFILWNYALPHLKLMPLPLLALVPPLIAGVIGWVNPVPNFCLLFFIVMTYLCRPLIFLFSCVSCQCSLYCPAFHVDVISRINCLLMSLSLWVMLLLNICILVFRDNPRGSDGYHYYVFFIYHFIKYCLFFPIHNKSDVSFIFVHFTIMVENQFSKKNKKIYSDNCGEFIKLRPIVAARGISHFTIAPWHDQKIDVLSQVQECQSNK